MTTAFQSGAFQADSFQIDAAPSTNYTLTCNAGTYALTGIDATLLRSKYIAAQAGTYSETGVNATLKVDKKLTATAGSYSVTGQNATITYAGTPGAYTLTCLAGAYVLSGANAGITATQTRRRAAGGKRQYEIKGKRYWLTPLELEQLVAQMLGELNRNEVVDADNKIITRRAWSRLQNSIKQAESRLGFALPIETVIVEDEDDDEEALLMLI